MCTVFGCHNTAVVHDRSGKATCIYKELHNIGWEYPLSHFMTYYYPVPSLTIEVVKYFRYVRCPLHTESHIIHARLIP